MTDEEQEKVDWLKSQYQEVPINCPQPKRVKLSDVHEHFEQKYSKTSHHQLARLIRRAFPNAESKLAGKSRCNHIFGILPKEAATHEDSTAHTSYSQQLEKERADNRELRERIRILEERVKQLEHMTPHSLAEQADGLMRQSCLTACGPDTYSNFQSFSIDGVIRELQEKMPDIYALFMQLGDVHRNLDINDTTTPVEEMKAVTSLCTLLNARSSRVKGIQLLLSMMLIARSTTKQALSVLNHAGICMSYSTTWSYLRQLTTQARYSDMVREGHWIWVYDNLNMHQRVRHERTDHHSTMLNLTSRMAVDIQNLPHWEVDWSDNKPQKTRSSLTCADFLPDEADATELQKRAVLLVMEILTTEFTSLSDLQKLVPQRESPNPVCKSVVVPMQALFKDEKYKSETIDILSALMKDAALTGTPQAIVGDQLTCKTIRGSKRWRLAEVDPMERLTWAHEVPGDFHFLWECLRAVFLAFWGTPSFPGSLCNLREYLNRKQVNKSVTVFSVGDEFLQHVFKAHMVARICSYLKVKSTDDSINHDHNMHWLKQTAEDVVAQTLCPASSDDTVFHFHKSFLHLAFLYNDLRLAIRWEDGPHVIRHWKLWIPHFLGTGMKNYALEAANLIANIKADFPAHIAYIATNNRTVNMQGKPGKGKPIDQLIEHYNLIVKQTLQASGSNATEAHITEVSLSALFLLEAAKKTDRQFGITPESRMHTIQDARNDINKIAQYLREKDVIVEIAGRTSPHFIHPVEKGWERLSKSDWLPTVLAGSLVEEEEVQRGEVSLEYELFE